MPIILNQNLYNDVKKEADNVYKKSSAYKSGWIVKTYKDRGGKYRNDNKPKLLKNIKNNNIYIAIFFYLNFFRLTVGQKYDTNLIDRSDLESVLDLFTSS